MMNAYILEKFILLNVVPETADKLLVVAADVSEANSRVDVPALMTHGDTLVQRL